MDRCTIRCVLILCLVPFQGQNGPQRTTRCWGRTVWVWEQSLEISSRMQHQRNITMLVVFHFFWGRHVHDWHVFFPNEFSFQSEFCLVPSLIRSPNAWSYRSPDFCGPQSQVHPELGDRIERALMLALSQDARFLGGLQVLRCCAFLMDRVVIVCYGSKGYLRFPNVMKSICLGILFWKGIFEFWGAFFVSHFRWLYIRNVEIA